ncbi:transcriptional regulator, LacI family [Alkalibacterium putridalgicola]|uniref:LacI family transcriptional regulator n=1 Tax=Alkalibacterium putridalgicola TaxID=426703 RepID=A0A1H7VR86_9LACT|nr:LacI family DNA-binding transcriptional regulator [Alkalibacterium putridalgicola]GEK89863.1 LacI family transcriptional regulator [Alkalibacterium putridalgicola]SEM11574.1 transcriptional regulator, LacI family [Alkalibacterium putridalgicola]
MKRVTIHDVAKEAGVSVTTVSRVLNDRGYISTEMKEKVLKAIKELNYIPNEMARSFFSNQSKFIALIVPTTENPFFGELTFRIEKALAKFGYHLFICNSLNDPENEEKYLRLLNEKRVDGIIVGSHNVDISEYKNYENQIVSIERKLTENIPMIQSDDYNGGVLATRELISQGCSNILCVIGDKNVETPANDRSLGYISEMEKNNLKPRFIEIPFQIGYEEKYKIIKDTFQTKFNFDGVFAGDDVNAKLFMNVAKEMNYDIPEDIKIVGFDGTQTMRSLVPELSTVVQPIEQLANEAVKILLDLLQGKKVKKESTLPVELYLSRTTNRIKN